jgi:hypothetical protein
MAGFRIEGNTSGNVAEVDASNRIKVVPSGGTVALVNGDGDYVRTIAEGRLDVGQDTLLFLDGVDDTVPDSRKWLQYLTTQTITVSGNMLVLNGAAVTTLNTNSGLLSHGRFQYQHESAVYMHAAIIPVNIPATNATAEWGFGIIASATDRSAPTDGAFFRWNSAGQFLAVLSTGGTETTSAALTPPSDSEIHHFEIELNEQECVYEIDGVEVAVIPSPVAGPPTASSRLPAFARVYTAASAPSLAPQLKIAGWAVTQQMLQTGRTNADIAVLQGQNAIWSPVTAYAGSNGSTNALVLPATGAQSNTTAPITTLGGRTHITAPAGADLATPVDALLFAYAVPTGQKFVCTGWHVAVTNLGAAVATTATTIELSAGFGATAASLATADSFAASPQPTYAPRKLYLGVVNFPVAAGIGQTENIVRTFTDSPIICEGGKYVHGIMRVIVGTATASQTLRFVSQPIGYFI